MGSRNAELGNNWKLEIGNWKSERTEGVRLGRWAGKSIAQRAERIVYCE